MRFDRLSPILAIVLLASVLLPSDGNAADRKPFRPLQGYGTTVNPADAAVRPDPALRYRVVFSVTRAAAKPGEVNPSLEKVARFLNLLGQDGVRIHPGDIVAVVHGPATPIVLTDAAYLAHAGDPSIRTNPNLALIEALRHAGVVVSVCSQALHGQKIEAREVAPGVRRDVAALTTLANLQLRGYALIPD